MSAHRARMTPRCRSSTAPRGRYAAGTRRYPSAPGTPWRAAAEERVAPTAPAKEAEGEKEAQASAPGRSVKDALKMKVLTIGAQTDRGQLLFRQDAYAPLDKYNADAEKLARAAIGELCGPELHPEAPTAEDVNGTWELVYCTKQLFRSSPFFMAIREAFGDATWHAPWADEATAVPSGELFFRLHELQVKSWGTSTVGKVIQTVELDREDGGANRFVSSFDTILFALTVIPIIGWFKLLPTFGARVVTESRDVRTSVDEEKRALVISMEVEKTTVNREEGLPEPPFGLGVLMGVEWPVNAVWKLLPWNNGRAPTCETTVLYCDDDFRVNTDRDGELFVYTRCVEGDA